MHVIDHSLARPSPAAAALVSGSPQAGGKPGKARWDQKFGGFQPWRLHRQQVGYCDSPSKAQGGKARPFGCCCKTQPCEATCPSKEPPAARRWVGRVPASLPSAQKF